GQSSGALLGELPRFLGRHWLAEDIALDERTAETAHERQLFMCLDALGRRLHVQIGREPDHRADQRRVAALRIRRAGDKRAVDLDLVERDSLQIAEARIAGSEIVEREL